jgi:hypothetical protein
MGFFVHRLGGACHKVIQSLRGQVRSKLILSLAVDETQLFFLVANGTEIRGIEL